MGNLLCRRVVFSVDIKCELTIKQQLISFGRNMLVKKHENHNYGRYDSGVYCPYRRDKDAASYASREEAVEAAEAKWRESSGKTSEM